jgi:acyl-CoA thioester hydrolase
MDGFGFSTELSVRFAETDAQGVAHNSAYLVWYEVARIDYLAEHIGGYQRLRDAGYEALTIEVHVRYATPAFFDDRLRVHARVSDVRGARFRFDYRIERGEELVADGWTRHAVVARDTLRPARLPPWLVDAIASAERRDQPDPAESGRPA